MSNSQNLMISVSVKQVERIGYSSDDGGSWDVVLSPCSLPTKPTKRIHIYNVSQPVALLCAAAAGNAHGRLHVQVGDEFQVEDRGLRTKYDGGVAQYSPLE